MLKDFQKPHVTNAQNFFSAEYATPIWGIVAKKSNLGKILGQMVSISQKFIIIRKNLLENITLCGNSNVW